MCAGSDRRPLPEEVSIQEQNRVQWVYSAQNDQELEERYDAWAGDYDSDLEVQFGWVGPRRAAEALAKYVPQSSKILDAGAGTGLVGEILVQMGYGNLVAMDLSSGMLEQASNKGIYRQLHRMVMGGPLDFLSGSFDASISVGVLTVGHAPASSLDELVRVTRTGGHIVFTLRPDVYEQSGFKEKQASLESEGKWRLAEVSEQFQPLPKGEPEVYHQVWVYRAT